MVDNLFPGEKATGDFGKLQIKVNDIFPIARIKKDPFYSPENNGKEGKVPLESLVLKVSF